MYNNLHNGQGYSYHILDCIVPPSVGDDQKKSLFSLQNHCAKTIVRDIPLNCQLLSNTPTHLHKVIWKAYLREKYYMYVYNIYKYDPRPFFMVEDSDLDCGATGGILLPEVPELLYHWPQAVFNLKELMPKLPPRHNRFSLSRASESPYSVNKDCLFQFYKIVVSVIVNTFNTNYNARSVELHKHNWKIRNIDVSGFHTFELATYFQGSFKWCPVQCPVLDSIGKIELVIDAGIDYRIGPDVKDVSIEYDSTEDIIRPCCASSTNSVIYKFVCVNVNHSLAEYEEEEEGPGGGDPALLVKSFMGSGAKSFLFQFKSSTFPTVLQNAFENEATNEYITGISLLKRGIDFFESPDNDKFNSLSTLKLVHRFTNLAHLNLRNICLHGRLDGLRNMHQGLVYLSLTQCSLKNIDMQQLIGSIHESTLRELNLSENEFKYDKFSNKLIQLCKSLKNIQMLALQGCGLESWPSDKIAILFDSLKLMPNIVYLDLSLHIFSSDQFLHIMGLHVNHSLRYLNLSLPEQYNESQGEKIIKKYRAKINTNMNKTRSQLLYVELGRFETDYW